MNSLLGYGSDDDLDDYPDEKVTSHGNSRNYRRPGVPKQDDTNYDEVQMSLSEDSDSEPKNAKSAQYRERDSYQRDDGRRNSPTKDRYRSEDKPRNRERDDSDKTRGRDEDRDRVRGDRYRNDREDDRSRDKRDERQRSRSKERSSMNRDDRHSRDRKERSDRRRSRSPRDRRRSRSPRRHDRSRSRSRDRGNRGGYYRRNDRPNNRDRYNNRSDPKLDNQPDTEQTADSSQPKDRFFMPGITGRFRDQIEKRKLLWQKSKDPVKPQTIPNTSQTTKVWETTTFAQDTDGKVASKFKRLMGIKNPGEGSGGTTEVLKKQEEMFSSMEAQYEVARTATHTMRGVGLGFGSYQR